MSTTRHTANVSEVLDTFCDTQLIRHLAIASHWTDRLAALQMRVVSDINDRHRWERPHLDPVGKRDQQVLFAAGPEQ